MKWLVVFRQEQRNCCPPGKYWIERQESIEASSADQAREDLMKAWRYNHAITIKTVERIDNEQGE
jgi:hypothetical protein